MNQRRPQWPTKLTLFMNERKNAPFKWGENDCCLFACDWIERATGLDPASGFRGRYRSKSAAQKILVVFGGTVDGLAKAICRKIGFVEIIPEMAQRGDLVLYKGGRGDTLGVVDDTGAHVCGPGANGLERFTLTWARAAWKVG